MAVDRLEEQNRVVHTPRGDVLIRPGREEDAGAYRQIRLEALKNHPDAFGTAYEKAAALPAEYWPERLRGAGTTAPMMFFAWAGQELVGLCGLAREDGVKVDHNADLISMYVRTEWRGVGIADALIDAVLDWGRRNGVRIVRLSVVRHNLSARRVYERSGFERYGTEPEYIHQGGAYHDMVLMFRHL